MLHAIIVPHCVVNRSLLLKSIKYFNEITLSGSAVVRALLSLVLMMPRIVLQLITFCCPAPYLVSSRLRVVTHTNKTLSNMSSLRYSIIESFFFLKDYYLLNDMV